MNDLTQNFGAIYVPVKAFVLYKKQADDYNSRSNPYVECFDMDGTGAPINAHRLSVQESDTLSKLLSIKKPREGSFLTPKGLMPRNVLYLNSGKKTCAIWHTPPQKQNYSLLKI